jgi:hypothetical protein
MGYVRVSATITKYTKYAAKNFPTTILEILLGVVKSKTSVPFLLSSAYILIVNIEQNIISIKAKIGC